MKERSSLLPNPAHPAARHMLRTTLVVLAAATIAILLTATLSLAGGTWSPQGVPVCTAYGSQYGQMIATDGAGGAIVTWQDGRSNRAQVYAQRLDASGRALWAPNGVAVAPTASYETNPDIVSDGAGGVIIAWVDHRAGLTVYAQRLNGAGVPRWAPGGVAVFPGGNMSSLSIVSDGAGGAVVVVPNWVSPLYTLMAQRVNSSGVTLWAAPTMVSNSQYSSELSLVQSGPGGTLITWEDGRNGNNNTDVYAQRLDGAGNAQWVANGVPVCIAAGNQAVPDLTADGTGGAVVAWQDLRSNDNTDVYAQKVTSAGHGAWAPNGVRVCVAPGNQDNPTITGDTAGGAIVTWEDDRSPTASIYAQKVLANGAVAPGWTSNGVPVGTAPPGNFQPQIISDGSGGAIIAWSAGTELYFNGSSGGDGLDLTDRVLVQQVLSSGRVSPGWAPNGEPVCPAADTQLNVFPQLVADGAGGAIVCWEDYRSGNDDVYAQRMKTTTYRWYLAEGSSAWGYQTYISIQNPNPAPVTARRTYMTPSGPSKPCDLKLPAASQTTISPIDDLKYATDFSTEVECVEGKPIAVDRTMKWTGPGAPSEEAHSSVGVNSPASTWYLPEGCSGFGFEDWLLVQNPNGTQATCTLTYMLESGKPATFVKNVPPRSRRTFNMADDVGAQNASTVVTSDVPVIAERAMYRNNRREGHESIGATQTSSDYFLAEGTTAWGFTTYVLVQNPNESPSFVSLTYMTPAGAKSMPPFSMAGYSRKTVKVNDQLPNTDFSTQVHSDQPIVAERAMYWGAGTPLGEAMHDSVGTIAPSRVFYMPDGQSSQGRETFTLVQNPNKTAVSVKVTYMTPDGKGDVTLTANIPALSRTTFNMAQKIADGRAAVLVECTTPGTGVMAERSMYWNGRGAGTCTIGGGSY